jgi:DNA topoisomerase-1
MMERFVRSNYPKCDEVYWNKPVVESCPKCIAPILLGKTTKKEGTFRYCKNEECDYKMPVDNPETAPVNETEATAPVA